MKHRLLGHRTNANDSCSSSLTGALFDCRTAVAGNHQGDWYHWRSAALPAAVRAAVAQERERTGHAVRPF